MAKKTTKKTSKESKSDEDFIHPIAKAIDEFLHIVRDIKDIALTHIPYSIDNYNKQLSDIKKEIKAADKLLKSRVRRIQVLGISKMELTLVSLEHLQKSNTPAVLETSLYNYLFSSFDKFMGELLTSLYNKKPELFSKITRTIQVSEVLSYSSFEEIKQKALREEIETFRRKSYHEQFEELEKSHGITLTKFERWPAFIERCQRRNLLTHCDGIVSEQYIKTCLKYGYKFEKTPKVGDKISIGPNYFYLSCLLLSEVAYKLGHTIWRKILPNELEESDKYLINSAYDLLLENNWRQAQVFGEFNNSMPDYSSDLNSKICLINYVIALKFGKNQTKADEILSSVDWSSTTIDLRLAEAILRNNYEQAASLMLKLGRASELIDELAYHNWPLFNEFRKTKEFLSTYEKVYKQPFMQKITKVATIASETADKIVKDKNYKKKSNNKQPNQRLNTTASTEPVF